jgi:hypothetical protein
VAGSVKQGPALGVAEDAAVAAAVLVAQDSRSPATSAQVAQAKAVTVATVRAMLPATQGPTKLSRTAAKSWM